MGSAQGVPWNYGLAYVLISHETSTFATHPAGAAPSPLGRRRRPSCQSQPPRTDVHPWMQLDREVMKLLYWQPATATYF